MVGAPLESLGDVYDSLAPRIYRYIYHRLGDQRVAEDLTSEVFLRLLRSNTSPDNLIAFLYRIAHNQIVDYMRRRRLTLPLDESVPDNSNDPVRLAEAKMERHRLRRALLRLTADQQQVIVLKYLEGLSNEEIARVIGKPVGAVKALQHRGLVTLRTLLDVPVRMDWQVEMAGE